MGWAWFTLGFCVHGVARLIVAAHRADRARCAETLRRIEETLRCS